MKFPKTITLEFAHWQIVQKALERHAGFIIQVEAEIDGLKGDLDAIYKADADRIFAVLEDLSDQLVCQHSTEDALSCAQEILDYYGGRYQDDAELADIARIIDPWITPETDTKEQLR